MKYPHLVYDFADRSPWNAFISFPLIFIVIGVVMFFISKKFGDSKTTGRYGITKRKYGMISAIVIVCFSIIFFLAIVPSMDTNYLNAKAVYDNKDYKVVEGIVENYHPMPEEGKDTERFSIDSVEFEFSDFVVGDYGYNNAASRGGAIKEGLKVRISYFNNGSKNVILKLETQ